MNPNLPNLVATPPLAADITTALGDRVLTMATSFSPDLLDQIDPNLGGLVVTGARAHATVAELAGRFPGIPILIEPTTVADDQASVERPFILADDGLFPETVQDLLDGQRRAGASFVVTPSGQVPAGDSATLKALVGAANDVSGSDVLTLVAVPDVWLTTPWDKTLCAVLKTSEHPVLLSLINSSADPLERKGAVAGYRRVAEELGERVVGWRTDLSGLGLISCGALGAAIGVRPSQRRLAAFDRGPRSSDKRDGTPHVLLADLMRFSRSSVMHTDWFASEYPDTCVCRWCGGADIDRFDDSHESIELAHLHNAAILQQLVGSCMGTSREQRSWWWRRRIEDAVAAHAELEARINRPISQPAYFKRWQEAMG